MWYIVTGISTEKWGFYGLANIPDRQEREVYPPIATKDERVFKEGVGWLESPDGKDENNGNRKGNKATFLWIPREFIPVTAKTAEDAQ